MGSARKKKRIRWNIRPLKTAGTALIAILLVANALAATGKAERVEKPTQSSVSDAVWSVLDPQGYRLTLDDGSEVGQIWLRKSLPAANSKEEEGVLFPEIAPSTLVAVISFSTSGSDFRGQPIKAGFYTLRYELLPNDGNHLGVAPSRDFVLAVPAEADSNPNSEFKFDELLGLSRKTTGTQHPAPLSLVQADGTMPGLIKDDQDHWVFSVKLPIAGGEPIPIGLIVKGTAAQ